MRAKWPIFAGVLVLGAAYLAWPYATLYRLDSAARRADVGTLRSLVDWYSVREGLKEDICDMVLDEPSNDRPSNELAPFGASFVRGMTGNALDRTVTPETFVSMARTGDALPRTGGHVQWAFFESPTQFAVELRTADAAEPIRLVMELHGLRWRVQRVFLPNKLLELASSSD
jgi:hypothetical protein